MCPFWKLDIRVFFFYILYYSYGKSFFTFVLSDFLKLTVRFPTTILYIINIRVREVPTTFNPNQYHPITILVARTQCVFPVSLRTGKRRARTTVKRIVISPADKQKQTTPTLSYYQSQSCCAYIVSLEPGVISGLYCLSAWELFLFKWNL